MEMDYRGVRIDGFFCNQKTREKAFLRHFAMDRQNFSSQEHIYPFRITEREGGLSLCGKVTFVRGALNHITLQVLNGVAGQDLCGFVESMLGGAKDSAEHMPAYFFRTMELLIRRDALTDSFYLDISFYRAVRHPFFHFDNPRTLSRLYRYRGIRRYLKMYFLIIWTGFFAVLSWSKTEQAKRVAVEGTHTYEEGFRYAFTEEDAYYEEGLQRAIERDLRATPLKIETCYTDAGRYGCTAVIFMVLTLYAATGLYHLERSPLGRSVRKFVDGRDRDLYLQTLREINEELAAPLYRDYYITITDRWVIMRDYPLYQARCVPRRSVTAVTEGVIRYRNKHHTIRRPCLDIYTPDGLLHKYAQKADKMQQVKAILGGL